MDNLGLSGWWLKYARACVCVRNIWIQHQALSHKNNRNQPKISHRCPKMLWILHIHRSIQQKPGYKVDPPPLSCSCSKKLHAKMKNARYGNTNGLEPLKKKVVHKWLVRRPHKKTYRYTVVVNTLVWKTNVVLSRLWIILICCTLPTQYPSLANIRRWYLQ